MKKFLFTKIRYILFCGVGLLMVACGGETAISTPTPPSSSAVMQDVATVQVTETAVLPTPAIEPTQEVAMIDPVPLGEAGSRNLYTMNIQETSIQYVVLLPDDFSPENSYPVLLALPPGAQTRSMIDAGLDLYWERAAPQRGWIVVSPAAPMESLYFDGSEALIPEFLQRVAATYPPEGGKFHVAGISNGGLSAFRIVLNDPDLFHSLMAMPGFPRTNDDFAKLDRLVDMPVAMFVGEGDGTWLVEMEKTEEALTALGGTVSLKVAEDEGHVIQSLTGDVLFDLLDSYR
ncbi:MAG: hypothetical protein GY943_05940 [Chloroflexi bacterium]|nr:hypothetical protein [Chloroflexota bacterium]